jgi:hypothetical protein
MTWYLWTIAIFAALPGALIIIGIVGYSLAWFYCEVIATLLGKDNPLN